MLEKSDLLGGINFKSFIIKLKIFNHKKKIIIS